MLSGRESKALTIADLGQDGRGEFLVTYYGTSPASIAIYWGDPLALLTKPGELASGVKGDALVTVDLDGNGWPDVAAASCEAHSLVVLFNEGARRFDRRSFPFVGCSTWRTANNNKQSAGKSLGQKIRKGNPHLRTALVESA